MSDYSKIKQSPEYREARQEVRSMIEAFLKPINSKLDALERLSEGLKEQPKASMMIFAAVFGALSENPATIRKIIENLNVSMNAAAEQGAHVVVRSQLSQAATLLEALLQLKN
jgi:hypothetical protein